MSQVHEQQSVEQKEVIREIDLDQLEAILPSQVRPVITQKPIGINDMFEEEIFPGDEDNIEEINEEKYKQESKPKKTLSKDNLIPSARKCIRKLKLILTETMGKDRELINEMIFSFVDDFMDINDFQQ